jgi:outer membrane receptor protein involved in Fe transport
MLAGTHRDETFDWQTSGSNLRCWSPVPPGQVPRGTGVCAAATQFYRTREAQVRLASPDRGPFHYLVGASYLEYTSSWFGYQPLTGSAFFSVPTDEVENRSAYAAVSAELPHQFRVGLEGRYTSEDLVTTGHSACIFPATSLIPQTPCAGQTVAGGTTVVGNPFTGEPLGGMEVLSKQFGKFTYRVTADRQWGERAMLYAIYSFGNQPGRFNAGLPPAFDRIRTVEEEELRNAEIGIKSQWQDGRLLFNAALYRMNWSNQVFRRTIVLDDPGGFSILQAALINGGDSRITGVEIEAGARPTRELELRATLAYTHAVFGDYCSEFYYQLTGIDTSPDGRGRCRNVDGNYLEAQPKWTGSIAADYERSLGISDWSWFARGDYAYLGRKFESELNFAWVPAARTADLRIGLSNPRWRIEAFALNLTNDRTPERLARLSDASLPTTAPGSTPAGPRVPGVSNLQSLTVIERQSRQFGLRVQYRFGSLRD